MLTHRNRRRRDNIELLATHLLRNDEVLTHRFADCGHDVFDVRLFEFELNLVGHLHAFWSLKFS